MNIEDWKVETIQDYSEDRQKKILEETPGLIQYFDNPSFELKRIALMTDPHVLKYLHGKTEYKLLKILVIKYPHMISRIKSDDLLRKLAVRHKPLVISCIKKPSPELQWMAVRRNPTAIKVIHNPCEKVQHWIAEKHPRLIPLVRNALPEIELLRS